MWHSFIYIHSYMMIGDPIQARARHQEEEKKNGANQQLWEPRPGRGHPACGHALFQGYQRQGTTAGTVREQGQAAEPQGEALLEASDLWAAVSFPGFPHSRHCRPHNSLLTNNSFLPVSQRKKVRPKKLSHLAEDTANKQKLSFDPGFQTLNLIFSM